MNEDDITYLVRGAALEIHKKYGPGMLESIYEKLLTHRLEEEGLSVRTQVPIYLNEPGLESTPACFADIIVEDLVILELKAVEKLPKVAYKQLLTYLKLTNLRVGVLINFNVEYILREGIHRILNG